MSSLAPAPTVRRRGRPPCCPPEVTVRVVELRRRGLSLARTAEVLNAEGVPTPTGRARWTKSHVDRLLHTQHAQNLIAELDAPAPDRARAVGSGVEAGPRASVADAKERDLARARF